MNALRKRTHIFAVTSVIGIGIGIILLLCGPMPSKIQPQLLSAFIIPVSLTLVYLWMREYIRLKIAHLIVENQILHICPVVINDGTLKAGEPQNVKRMDVFISYFGILLDSRIIKFNQDGIQLKNVEFGSDFISLTYGTENCTQSTRLLCSMFDREELDHIAEKFRYETGITPMIIK